MNGCRSFVTCKEGTTIFMVIHAFYENFYIQPSFKYSKKGLACKRCWFSVATYMKLQKKMNTFSVNLSFYYLKYGSKRHF